MFVFMCVTQCLDYSSFVVSFKISKSSNFHLLYQDCFQYFVSFFFFIWILASTFQFWNPRKSWDFYIFSPGSMIQTELLLSCQRQHFWSIKLGCFHLFRSSSTFWPRFCSFQCIHFTLIFIHKFFIILDAWWIELFSLFLDC